MGKRSVKENKNIYQISRENMNLTRDAASELMVFISPERIEKIESGKVLPHPDEVLAMESGYRNPELSGDRADHLLAQRHGGGEKQADRHVRGRKDQRLRTQGFRCYTREDKQDRQVHTGAQDLDRARHEHRQDRRG